MLYISIKSGIISNVLKNIIQERGARMESYATLEQAVSNFNRTTGLNLTIEEARAALGVKKRKPLFMNREEYDKEVAKRKNALRIALNNIVVMREELVDDEKYFNEANKKYNDLCVKCGKPVGYQKEMIPKYFEFSDLEGRNPFEWENFMKDRITQLVDDVRSLRGMISYLREECDSHT